MLGTTEKSDDGSSTLQNFISAVIVDRAKEIGMLYSTWVITTSRRRALNREVIPKTTGTHHPLCVRRVVADLWATSMRLQQELTRHPTLSSAVALPSTLLNIFLPSTSQWMLTLVFCPQENLSYGFSQHTHLPACGCPGAGCMWDMEVGNLDGV